MSGVRKVVGVAIVLVVIAVLADEGSQTTSGIDAGSAASSFDSGSPSGSGNDGDRVELGQTYGPRLRIESWRCYHEHGYQFVAGEVTNISDRRLENVTVVATFRDGSGNFVKSTDALIDYDPILPDQTSPFEAGTTGNPAIERCSIDFKHLMGGTISYTTAERERDQQRDRIRRAQGLLNDLGYDAGPEDGLMGPSTRSAIEAFQRDKGFAVDGELDEDLLIRLVNAGD